MKWRIAMATLISAIALEAGPIAANAADPSPRPGPAPSGQGIDGMIAAPPIQHGNQPLLFERYGIDAYLPAGLLHIDPGSAIANTLLNGPAGMVVQELQIGATFAASWMISILLGLGTITTRLLEWTFSMDFASGASGPLGAVTRSLAQNFYAPLLPFVIVLVGAWLVWHWLIRQRFTFGLGGLLWMLVALALGGLYMSSPVEVMSEANQFTAGLASAMLDGVSAADPQMSGRVGDPTMALGPQHDAELRQFNDRIWRTFFYGPWTSAEFGAYDPKVPGTNRHYGEELLAKNAGEQSSFDQDIGKAPGWMQDFYNGGNGLGRAAVALFSLMVAMLGMLLYLFMALAVIGSQIGYLVLLMVAPPILLIGTHPGLGRNVLIRWLGLVLGMLGVRLLYSLFLAIVLVLGGVIATAGADMGYVPAALLQLLLVGLAIWFRKPFIAVFSHATRIQVSQGHHVTSGKTAAAAHGAMGWARHKLSSSPEVHGQLQAAQQMGAFRATKAMLLRRPLVAAAGSGASAATATAGTGTAAAGAGVKAAAVKGGAAAGSGGWAVLAVAGLKLGQMAVRRASHTQRKAQGYTSQLLPGGGGTPTHARMAERPLVTGSRRNGASAGRTDAQNSGSTSGPRRLGPGASTKRGGWEREARTRATRAADASGRSGVFSAPTKRHCPFCGGSRPHTVSGGAMRCHACNTTYTWAGSGKPLVTKP